MNILIFLLKPPHPLPHDLTIRLVNIWNCGYNPSPLTPLAMRNVRAHRIGRRFHFFLSVMFMCGWEKMLVSWSACGGQRKSHRVHSIFPPLPGIDLRSPDLHSKHFVHWATCCSQMKIFLSEYHYLPFCSRISPFPHFYFHVYSFSLDLHYPIW